MAKGDDALAIAAAPSVTAQAVTGDAADEPRPDITPGLATMPRDVSSAIEGYLDKPGWANYRQVSKGVAAVVAEGVQSVAIHRREDLSPALEAFAKPGLKKLTARSCGLGGRELQKLAANTSITSLDLDDNNIGDEGAQHLARNTSLTSLNLGDNNIRDGGAEHLAANTSITSLSLDDNFIGDEGAQHLARNTTITSLNLGDNNIGDEGAQHLAANTTITSLDLHYNHIGDQGAQHLAANTSITSLDLRVNSIGPIGIAALEAERGRFTTLLL